MNEVSDRVNKILESSIIIDSLTHGPLLITEDLIKSSNEMLALEMNIWDILPDLILQYARNVASNDHYFAKYIDAWKESGVTCVSYTLGPIYPKPYSLEAVYHNHAFMTHMLDQRKDFFVKVLKAEDIERAYKEKKKAIILNFQSLEHLGTDINFVELGYMQGFRIMQLTYNTKIPVGTGCTARRDRGLTEFGLEVVDKINELGVLVDVSHCGVQTSKDAVEHSKDPILVSHSGSKKLNEHVRNKDDDLLQAVAEKGGYIGVFVVPFLSSDYKNNTVDDWADHVEYIVNLVGIDHVGIGSDFYGYSMPTNLAMKVDEQLGVVGFRPEDRATFTYKVKGFEEYRKFPNLIKALVSRGYSDQEIKKIAGENFLRVFRKVVG